jgi:CDP-diacylglycerol--serine O-phosphatidyltransferase
MITKRLHLRQPAANGRRQRRIRPIAVLPTLFTLGNLWCGFFAIVVAARVDRPEPGAPADFEYVKHCALGGTLIFIAMVLDALDGYLARLAKAGSNFGAYLDSLADLVTFGVAPAFLLVKMCPSQELNHSNAVWIIAAVFASCVALRLARFNAETGEDDDHMEFTGLPSPAGAAAIAGYALMFWALRRPLDADLMYADSIRRVAEALLPGFAVLVAALMVSRIPYPHVVNHLLQGDRSFQHVVLLVFAVMLVAVAGVYYSVPIICTAFVLVGPVRYLWRYVMHRRDQAHEEPLF